MSKLMLSLPSAVRRDSESGYSDALSSVAAYLQIVDWKDDEDTKAAMDVAAALKGLYHSSDIDCEYFPCVLDGPEPGTPAFYKALGIERSARAKVGGYDNPKVEVLREGKGKGKRPGFVLLSGLGDDSIKEWNEYMDEDEKEALDQAAKKLASLGTVHGINLCADDGAHRVLLTVAYRKNGRAVGIFTLRQET